MSLIIKPIKPKKGSKIIPFPTFTKNLMKPSVILHTACPMSGKSTILCNLMQHKLKGFKNLLNGLDTVYLYSPTAESDETFRFALKHDNLILMNKYTDESLKEILDYQEEFPPEKRPRIGILFDDFIAFGNTNPRSLMFRLVTFYRHLNIKVLYYSTQHFVSVPPVVRNNLNYCLLSRTFGDKEKEKIKEQFQGRFKNILKNLEDATSECQYDFLYLDIHGGKAFKNFEEAKLN
jgi:hypothetical protein